jgi:copper transport protein
MRSIGLLLLLGTIAYGPNPALAHASLIESDPADGTVLSDPPQHLTLRFNEPVAPLVLRLVSADGTSLTLDRYRLTDMTLIIDALPIGRGTHALSWRVVSEDGHPVGGTILFSVGAPSGAVPGAMEPGEWRVRVSIWLAKILIYAGLFIGVGGVCFGTFVAPLPRTARLACALTLSIGLSMVILSVGLQGLDALDEPLANVFRYVAWRTGFGMSYGSTVVVATCAMAAALVGLVVRTAILTKLLSIAALLGTGLALAASGHASAADPQAVMRPAVFVHVLGISLWIGALMPLGLILYERRTDAAAALSHFSLLIPYVIVPLVAAGVVLAIIQLSNISALWTTAYGRVLLAKLALLLVLFALAALNRWRLTKPAQTGEPKALRLLVQLIGVEMFLAAMIFAVAATWRFTPPPRSLEAAAAPPASIHIHSDRATANLTITPRRVGPVTASITVITGTGEAKEVTLVLSNAPAGIEPIRRSAVLSGQSIWRIDDLLIPTAGRWSVRIDVLISDFERIRLEDAIEIDG